ncbi:MAG: TetR/AcrR family transcriptional regulator [Actinomycetota bacterium]|nr:TetR/AcrR family transcriptional regulator [Actinomycetota bacterium]
MTRTLSTADARREAILEAALPLFAERGVSGTPTLAVAKASGISQAYLFRLFPTKADLAIALIERTNERVHETMASAAAAARTTGEPLLPTMGKAYVTLLQHDRDLLLLQLHAHAASLESPQIRDAMREGFRRLVAFITEVSGAPADEVQRFFARGMLLNVVAALDIWELDEPWARLLVAPPQSPPPGASC